MRQNHEKTGKDTCSTGHWQKVVSKRTFLKCYQRIRKKANILIQIQKKQLTRYFIEEFACNISK